ncbi:SDR family oxidoreductase [Pyxidicoccus fallax]|uniref:SDR family oxidoreductase n=1 Tax=Pyxidicoccus fallax TaxID=394095 RepID=A0A848LNL3_9BACT|nr:SDR family oxidoreductase [Pyxidicoccus fallax]NMO19428.1 SDR family oxidoreductase [Pyxidicoccus fallax]NPC81566.1 SDR family oxidoreductase [Pyxidicoccus fallax]
MGALDGKLAVVTGGGSGIGFAVAERFVREGAEVVIAGRRKERLDAAVAQLGPKARGIQTDVGDEEQVKRLIDSVPRVDVLVTMAGGAVFGALEEVPMKAWRDLFNDRYFGQLACCRYAVSKMAQGSSILLHSGIAGHAALPNYAGGAGLCGAVNAMGRSLAIELAPRGIRVNVLSPGLTRDTALDWGVPPEQMDAFMGAFVGRIPLKRPGTVHDMADAAFFLTTNAYATGMVIDLDGGWTAV